MLLMAAWLSAVVQRPLPATDATGVVTALEVWSPSAAAPTIRCEVAPDAGVHVRTARNAELTGFDCPRAIRLLDSHHVERIRIRSAPLVVVDEHRVPPYDATAPPAPTPID